MINRITLEQRCGIYELGLVTKLIFIEKYVWITFENLESIEQILRSALGCIPSI
jgi:hypothetical protein